MNMNNPETPAASQPDRIIGPPPVVEVSDTLAESVVEQPALEMISAPPGYIAPEVPTIESSAIIVTPFDPENSDHVVARYKAEQASALAQRMTPPAPGTPVETFVAPQTSGQEVKDYPVGPPPASESVAEVVEAVASEPIVNEVPKVITEIPGVTLAPAVEPEPKMIPYSPEGAAKIAQQKYINDQAMLQRMTPPTPGTPVETFVPPQAPAEEKEYAIQPPPTSERQ